MEPTEVIKASLKEKFISERGYWNGVWDRVLDHDPNFFEAYLDLSAFPWRQGVLPAKIKEFIYIAIDASTTHMYRPGLRVHIQNALRHGATKDEIMEVLQLSTLLGLQSCTVGAPLLIREMEASEKSSEATHELSETQQRLKARFQEQLGYWNDNLKSLLQLSPDFFETCLRFSVAPWKSGKLEKKYKELVYLSINAAVTHLQKDAMAVHMKNALAAGASAPEVLEVLELVSVLGIHSCIMGVGVLAEELKTIEEAKD